jgi:hypothetical protein
MKWNFWQDKKEQKELTEYEIDVIIGNKEDEQQ